MQDPALKADVKLEDYGVLLQQLHSILLCHSVSGCCLPFWELIDLSIVFTYSIFLIVYFQVGHNGLEASRFPFDDVISFSSFLILMMFHVHGDELFNTLIWYLVWCAATLPINSYGCVIKTNNIKGNCNVHLQNMICLCCKDVNWVLEQGKEPWMIHCTKHSLIHENVGIRYFSYTYYIIITIFYTMNNSWAHKGKVDTVCTYHIKLEETQDKNISHGFVKIGNLVIDTFENCMILNWIFLVYPFGAEIQRW